MSKNDFIQINEFIDEQFEQEKNSENYESYSDPKGKRAFSDQILKVREINDSISNQMVREMSN